MAIVHKPIFLPLLLVSAFATSHNWQFEKNIPGENPVVHTNKLVKTQSQTSAPVGNVGVSLKDRNGNLWFGTGGKGLYRYDARQPDPQKKSFTNFTIKDGLSSDMLLAIIEDKKGNLWFGTDAGISRYDGKTFNAIPTPGKFVTSLLEDKSGKLWVATNAGIYWYDAHQANGETKGFTPFLNDKRISNPNGLALRVVQDMLEDKQGNIWITTKDEGICRYDGKSIISYKPNDVLWFRGLFEDKDGTIWAGGINILCRFDARVAGGQWKTFSGSNQDNLFRSSVVYFITRDKAGNMWLGTEASNTSERENDGGVWLYNGTTFKNFTKTDGLSHNAVWCILEGRAGEFWFGTRRGLSLYDARMPNGQEKKFTSSPDWQ